uniref:Uncharacterized protein n=1 Tax=Oryza nivara TaxID=4536 RepID=A0A0E0FKS4_ORYNI
MPAAQLACSVAPGSLALPLTVELAACTPRGSSIQIWWLLIVRGLTPQPWCRCRRNRTIYCLGACGHRIRPVRSLEKGGVKFLVEKMEEEEGSCSCAATKMATSRAASKRANEEEGRERYASRPLASAHPRACTRAYAACTSVAWMGSEAQLGRFSWAWLRRAFCTCGSRP